MKQGMKNDLKIDHVYQALPEDETEILGLQLQK